MKNLPNYKEAKATLLTTLNVGATVFVNPVQEKKFSGVVVKLLDNQVVQVQDADGKLYKVPKNTIEIVDGKFVYTSMLGASGYHPDMQFVASFATEQQLKGTLSDIEIYRQSFQFFASRARLSYRKLVNVHIETINQASHALRQLGEYQEVTSLGKSLIHIGASAATDLLSRPEPTSDENFEYYLALHARLADKLVSLSIEELRDILTPEAAATLLADFS